MMATNPGYGNPVATREYAATSEDPSYVMTAARLPSHVVNQGDGLKKAPSPVGRGLIWSKLVLASAGTLILLVGLGIGIGIGSAIFRPAPVPAEFDPSAFPTSTVIPDLNLQAANLANGAAVTVRGIVVWDGRQTTAKGFYLQTPVGTTSPLGSEAIFVFCSTGTLCSSLTKFGEGADVEVKGKVSSIKDRGDTVLKARVSQSSIDQVTVHCNTPRLEVVPGGPKLCARVRVRQIQFPLPALSGANDYLVQSLGMMVEIVGANNDEMTLINNYNLGKYGEVGLSSSGLLYSGTQMQTPGPSAQAYEQENLRKVITLDDANFVTDARPTLFPEGGLADDDTRTLRVGQTIPVSNLTGFVVLDRRNQAWRLQPNEMVRTVLTAPLETQVTNDCVYFVSKYRAGSRFR